MDANSVLLVGCCKRDGRNDGTGLLVRLRPNMDSSCSEAIMTRFTGNSVGGRVTVGGGHLVEVGGCRGHSVGQVKGVGKEEAVATFSGASVWVL